MGIGWIHVRACIPYNKQSVHLGLHVHICNQTVVTYNQPVTPHCPNASLYLYLCTKLSVCMCICQRVSEYVRLLLINSVPLRSTPRTLQTYMIPGYIAGFRLREDTIMHGYSEKFLYLEAHAFYSLSRSRRGRRDWSVDGRQWLTGVSINQYPFITWPSACDGPRAGSGVVRMDPLRFLAGCRTRRLNQV